MCEFGNFFGDWLLLDELVCIDLLFDVFVEWEEVDFVDFCDDVLVVLFGQWCDDLRWLLVSVLVLQDEVVVVLCVGVV